MPVLESEVEKKCLTYAVRELNMVSIKLTSSGTRGWPDRLFVTDWGFPVFIEFKRPGKKPRKLQWYRMDLLREQGCHVYWTDDLEEAKDILYAYMDPT